MTHELVLDVRTVPPARRHTQIFQTSEALAPGAGFYHQFAAERAGTFTWDYIETGPELWRVRIGRSATSAAKQIVSS